MRMYRIIRVNPNGSLITMETVFDESKANALVNTYNSYSDGCFYYVAK